MSTAAAWVVVLVNLMVVAQFYVGAVAFTLFARFSGTLFSRLLAAVWWVASVAATTQAGMSLAMTLGYPVWTGISVPVFTALVASIVPLWTQLIASLRAPGVDEPLNLKPLLIGGSVGLLVGLTLVLAFPAQSEAISRLFITGCMLVLLGMLVRAPGLVGEGRRAMLMINSAVAVQACRPLLVWWVTGGISAQHGVPPARQAVVLIGTLVFSTVMLTLDFWAVLLVERGVVADRFEGAWRRQVGAARQQRREALGALARGLASEISATVVTVSEFAAQARLSPDTQHEAEVLELAAEQGAVLLQRLTEVRAKPGAEIPTIDVATVLRTALPVLKRLSPLQSVRLNVDDVILRAECPPAELERAVTNLVLNARDASPLGGLIQIQAAMSALPPALLNRGLVDGDYVVVRVTDTGSGIPEAVMGRVFEPYFTTKGTKGTGLGLTSIRTFLRSIGGEITCESTVGQGTTFRMWIPSAVTAPSAGFREGALR